jgi:hypothetical protein
MPIVRSADAMVLLSGAHADDLAHLPRRLPTIGRWCPHPVLLLVGAGYSPAEVARELGVAPMGTVPDDPRGAAVLCGRPSTVRWGRRGPAHSPLGQLAHKVAKVLVAQQTPPRELPQQAPVANRPTPVLHAVSGVPGGPASVNGVRSAPLPPGHLTFPSVSPRPGAAS